MQSLRSLLIGEAEITELKEEAHTCRRELKHAILAFCINNFILYNLAFLTAKPMERRKKGKEANRKTKEK